MLCPHCTVKLSSVYWRAAIPGWRQNFISFPWYLIHWDPKVAPPLFWPVMPSCGFILASKNFPGASSNFSPKSSVALVCSSPFSATHPGRQGSKCPLSLSNGLGSFLRPFCAQGAQGGTGRTGTERGGGTFQNSTETEKCKAPD